MNIQANNILKNLAHEFNKPMQDIETGLTERFALEILRVMGIQLTGPAEIIIETALRTLCSLVAEVHDDKPHNEANK